ncbi:MAG: NAD(P) transhydrogenase subunit alpha, partial [Planctomycetes bacterium]|nr:NAD(P) transhydrogenase subunit alpha [Planctomycetota bacterium]
ELPAQDASRSSTDVVIPEENAAQKKRFNPVRNALMMGTAGILLALLGLVAPPAFLSHLTVFALACFIGYQVIWNVTPALHTPLMSVTNAISGIILVGAMLQINPDSGTVVQILAAFALLIAMINVAGGFLVTHRMLSMFRK